MQQYACVIHPGMHKQAGVLGRLLAWGGAGGASPGAPGGPLSSPAVALHMVLTPRRLLLLALTTDALQCWQVHLQFALSSLHTSTVNLVASYTRPQ